MTRTEANFFYNKIFRKYKGENLRLIMRELVLHDRFFLITRVMKRSDADNDWVYERCREVEADPDGYLDLWARGHYKSSIITLTGSIQEICRNPEITIGIFSFNSAIARSFLKQIMTELETNGTLKWLFPEIFWEDPKRDAKKYGFSWSGRSGIRVKRKSNKKNQTVEAHGLIEAQPTSSHYDLRIYNDVVTEDTAASEGMRDKALKGWQTSLNLGSESNREWYEGTIYHPHDLYDYIRKTGELKERIYPATNDGNPDGEPVYMTREMLKSKYKKMGPEVFAMQMLLKPLAFNRQGFDLKWLKYWDAEIFKGLNTMILVDPASGKGRKNDYSVFWVVGLGQDKNYYVIDMIRDKLSLTERANTLFKLHQMYNPVFVGYEEAAMQTDREHFEYVMEQNNYRFHITPLRPRGAKKQRILALVPLFEQGRIYLPQELWYTNWEMKNVNLIEEFIQEEYEIFPMVEHDDMLDSLANILHRDVYVPFPENEQIIEEYFSGHNTDEEDFDVYAV